MPNHLVLLLLLLVLTLCEHVHGNWNDWWTYDGISGPAYWGLINPAWTMCNKVGTALQVELISNGSHSRGVDSHPST